MLNRPEIKAPEMMLNPPEIKATQEKIARIKKGNKTIAKMSTIKEITKIIIIRD